MWVDVGINPYLFEPIYDKEGTTAIAARITGPDFEKANSIWSDEKKSIMVLPNQVVFDGKLLPVVELADDSFSASTMGEYHNHIYWLCLDEYGLDGKKRTPRFNNKPC